MIPVDQYKSFAKAVDMYAGYTELVATAENQHLNLIDVEEFTEKGKELCLVEFARV